MSDASRRAPTTERLIDRHPQWIASLASLLMHVLFVLALLYSSKISLAPPEGSSSGGARVKVDFLGEASREDQQPPVPPAAAAPPSDRPRPRKPLVTTAVASPVDATRVTEAETPVSPEEAQATPPAAEQAVVPQETRPPASQPIPAWRRSGRWGQPPGLLAQDTAPTNSGPTAGTGRYQGPGQNNNTPNMEVDGHQIYYDLRNELRLRDWQERGMAELSFPLPGRSEFMVCALEIVARRGSGGCRLVQPDDPALANIGDARDVVSVVRVYRRGELIWRGPGAYR